MPPVKLVLIETPFAPERGISAAEREAAIARHIEYASRCMRDSFGRGEFPFASHMLYAARPLILDDAIPEERELRIRAGLAWGAFATLTAVYGDFGISPGMRKGIEAASQACRPIEHRRLPAASWKGSAIDFEKLRSCRCESFFERTGHHSDDCPLYDRLPMALGK